jgi:glycosyltransferase involved in cell wall biosynthesis
MNRPRRPIRVAHVAAQLDTGGMERLLVEFARHADRERFHLHFVSLGERGNVAGELEDSGWAVSAMGHPPGLRPSLVLHLTNLFRRHRFDLIHAHNVRPLMYAGPAARLAGVPVVIQTRHGQRSGAPFATKFADAVVGVSEANSQLSIRAGVAAGKVSTIRNGVDVTRFDYTGPNPRGPAVAVGRLSPEKDPENLIRAAAIACAAEPEFRVDLAGEGPCRAALTDMIRSLELQSRVRLLGEVRDVAGLLARASQYVLPSRTEGISLGLLEAMARGLPVVATRVGGTPEVVEDGVSGFLVPAANPQALAAAMLSVYRAPGTALVMGRTGHERVCRAFDVRRTVAAYEALYLRHLGAVAEAA